MCGHIVCVLTWVLVCMWKSVICVHSLEDYCLCELKRTPIGLYGSWEPALSGSPLAISSHTPTTHRHQMFCDMVLLSVSQYQHSPLEQISTTCFCQLAHSYTCLNLYSNLWRPLVPLGHTVFITCLSLSTLSFIFLFSSFFLWFSLFNKAFSVNKWAWKGKMLERNVKNDYPS